MIERVFYTGGMGFVRWHYRRGVYVRSHFRRLRTMPGPDQRVLLPTVVPVGRTRLSRVDGQRPHVPHDDLDPLPALPVPGQRSLPLGA
jgi:phosphoribosyl 1,2-cyclic phosphodiesterase